MLQALLGFIATIVILAIATSAYNMGKDSVELINKPCPEQKEKLLSSSHSHTGTICVYEEPWKIKGNVKRIEL